MSVYWELGQALLPEHFNEQQDHAHQLSAYLYTSHYNSRTGIIDLSLNQDRALRQIVSLDSLSLILPNYQYARSGFNLHCSDFDFSDCVGENDTISVYLSISHEKKISTKIINQADVEYQHYHAELASQYDSNAIYSLKIFELQLTEEGAYTGITGFKPRLIVMPQIYAEIYYNLLASWIGSFRQKLQVKLASTSTKNQYMALFLRLEEIDYWLSSRKMQYKFCDLQELQDNLHSFYQICALLIYGMPKYIQLREDLICNIDHIAELIQKLLDNKAEMSSQFYKLEYKNGLYHSGILNDQFFASHKRYLLVRFSQNAPKEDEVFIKAFAPSRAQEILIRALPGIDLIRTDSLEIQSVFPDQDQIYEISDTDREWHSVLNDRVFCVKIAAQFNTETLQIEVACI